ncbi:MAG: hypothetical protein WAL63_09190 [Solirubrobacteraceae bacterium]
MGASELRIGEIRRRVLLGSEAFYRVCGWTDELAEVEVVVAPGLRPGQRFKFDVAAVLRMDLTVEPANSTGPAGQGS